ncbi:Pyrophosphate phospho-hydrolase [Kluyveromyces marxianus]
MRATRQLFMFKNHLMRRHFHNVTIGSKYSASFKQYLKLDNGEIGSYFHDVPLGLDVAKRTCNMVVEVPRWSNGKFEISKSEPFNPITQDIKKGKPRFVNNIFPYHGYIHNYGAIPQTWEQPVIEVLPGLKGDNDPLDCCEIGSSIARMGDIKQVKILGSLALIDDGELDWKVICIDVEDELTPKLHTLADVDKYMPGLLDATRTWFRDYKIPTGKPPNQFAFNGEYQDVATTLDTVQDCHNAWSTLVSDEVKTDDQKIELPTIVRAGTQIRIEPDEQPETPIPREVEKWWYL